ncbi:peptidyl-prolyl cis-trans isomerase C [Desulfobaculum xiamenense]|uniref:Peptidyl-prolyl cis-trans isomerase C n=1 Tax=Desulfobaculum xiamenense TaxID=995050 RepID=A0A846QQJ9_9BACT|nr:peptidylprolyl isomerase [Desulfobaculum xiamenense]NJB69260.1 peptidyl-prolyl cis-trans isomerase C [Desulfobaculum xiamenense]
MATCTASHILVDTEAACNDLLKQIAEGAEFADLARKHSKCPSGRRGGDLGSFRPGMMVPEFDKVCFEDAVGEVHGPVRTQFGYHLILIRERN